MLPRRLTPHGLPFSGMEVLSRIKSGATEETSLVESFMLESLDRIQTVCERAVTVGQYELVLAGAPHGLDDQVGPMPFTANHYHESSGWVNRSSSGNERYLSIDTPAFQLEMPPVMPNGITMPYFDADNAAQTFTDFALQIDEPALIHCTPGILWPSLYARRDALKIQFWAGETDELSWGGTDTFTTLSGYPWANGDRFQLRASGNQNQYLGLKASVPTGFTNLAQYYVVEASGSTFKLEATVGGGAITGTAPAAGFAIDKLYSGSLNGNTSTGVMKIAIDSFNSRCGEGECSVSKNDDSFMVDPILRRMIWRSPMYSS